MSRYAAAVLLLVLTLIPTLAHAADYDTLEDFKLGEPLIGKFSPRQMRGKLVMFTTWNGNANTSVEDAKQLKALLADVAPGTVILLATQAYEMPDEVTLTEWKKAEVEDPALLLSKGGEIYRGVTTAQHPAVLFDINGNIIEAGSFDSIGEEFKRQARTMPGWIVANHDFKSLKGESRRLARPGNGTGRTIADLRELASGERDRGSDARQEATYLLARIDQWIKVEQDNMDKSLNGDLREGLAIAQRMSVTLKGDKASEPFDKVMDRVKDKDEELVKALKAAEVWSKIDETIKAIGVKKTTKADEIKKIMDERKNQKQAELINQGVAYLEANFSGTWGAQQAAKWKARLKK